MCFHSRETGNITQAACLAIYPRAGAFCLMTDQPSSFILLSLQCRKALNLFFFPPFCPVFVFINTPRYKTYHLKKLGIPEQTKQGIFVRLNVAQKEPTVLSAIERRKRQGSNPFIHKLGSTVNEEALENWICSLLRFKLIVFFLPTSRLGWL